jgi:hypothetical protein
VSNNKVRVDIDNQANIDLTSDENYFGSAVVDIRASDGTNAGVTSFNVIVNNVNDKPEVELLLPRNNALVFSETVELKWYGRDIDPGETENLTYSIYIDTESGLTLYESGYTGTSIVLTGLQDQSTYYWKVIPHDGKEEGDCVTIPCPLQFAIDVGSKPICDLKLPANEAVTNYDYVVLMWEGKSDVGDTIVFDVYMSNESFDLPPPKSALIADSIQESELFVENLNASVTYYWTVIPSTARGVGSCLSGVWNFMYDPGANPYRLEIEAPESLKIPKGESYSTAIRIKNTGANADYVIPRLNAGSLKFVVELEDDGNELPVGKDGTLILILNISAETIPLDTYEITITAESIGSQEIEEKTIVVEIYEEVDDSQDLSTALLIAIPLIIVIIIIVTAWLMISRKKKLEEERKRVEAELLKPLPSQMMEAKDVQYFSGAGAGPAGAMPAQLPSVTMPGGGGAQAAQPGYPQPYGAGVEARPQLPPAMDSTAVQYPPGQVPAAPAPGAPQPQQPQYPGGVQPQQPLYPGGVEPQQPLYPGGVEPQQPLYPDKVQPQQPMQPETQPQYPPEKPQPRTGMPPEQVPYEPKVTMPGEEPAVDPKGGAPVQEPAPEGPVPVAVEQTPDQLLDTLKNNYFQGGVSEETYMNLKKELKAAIDSGATPDTIDEKIKQFINGQITEDEFKASRL